ncbi:hypothetical protein [Paenibacillus thiaminolyticus]|nr:hypothetical protein [Paenibacillus thiaminolyticus]
MVEKHKPDVIMVGSDSFEKLAREGNALLEQAREASKAETANAGMK